jgi:hypothetical protein
VTTVKEEIDITGSSATIVTCKVTKMVEVGLFKGPPKPEPTTMAPTTTGVATKPSNATVNTNGTVDVNATTSGPTAGPTTAAITTLAPEDIPHIVSFELVYPKENCTRKLNENATAFSDDIRSQIAGVVSIGVGSLKKFNVSCGSIKVNFQLTKESGGKSVQEVVNIIEQKVKAGTMQVTIDGQNVTADTASFKSHKDPDYITPPAPTPSEVDDDLSAGAIVGIVIAVIAAIVIVIAVVYVCCVKKTTRKQAAVRPEDQSDNVEMKGRSNDAYTDYP